MLSSASRLCSKPTSASRAGAFTPTRNVTRLAARSKAGGALASAQPATTSATEDLQPCSSASARAPAAIAPAAAAAAATLALLASCSPAGAAAVQPLATLADMDAATAHTLEVCECVWGGGGHSGRDAAMAHTVCVCACVGGWCVWRGAGTAGCASTWCPPPPNRHHTAHTSPLQGPCHQPNLLPSQSKLPIQIQI